MEDDNINYAPDDLVSIDYHECHWVEFSWNKYTERFLFPNDDIEYYDDVEFLCSCESDDDDDIMFDLLCEEMDEIFLQ